MARPRTPIGTYGDPYYEETDGGRQIAVVRFRDFDGRTRKIKAVGRSKAEALRRLKKKIANHEAASVGEEDLTADSLFVDLADAWLQSLDDTKRLAPSTRYRYERDLRTLVLPAFVSTSHRQRRPEAGPGPWWPLVVLTPLAPEAHLVGVTVSMRVVSAGKGYGYLLRSVVQGDGDATQASGFTRYFTDAGTPPGVWLGKGVTFFGAGELRPGMTAGGPWVTDGDGGVRSDVLGAQVGVGAVGSGGREHSGADRRGPPRRRRAGAGFL
ncbi:hypothetical protein V5H98_07275 [Georgenia sp. M64]|uniref:hypothetical protein n=1 Tax=Georgenia sp. M64 TaxID=3120520 RepID=UPI0030E4ED2C